MVIPITLAVGAAASAAGGVAFVRVCQFLILISRGHPPLTAPISAGCIVSGNQLSPFVGVGIFEHECGTFMAP